ncbi:hypothetical protein JOC94_001512 [Bacillus thermophilus]|uniref:Transposase n=1 Tax=Siminovitchia thermophila TaxID=1245522 RepID=A0ABS2R562_9BACI|nr:hypothetical protein [Siminovitchia thermophila]
MKENGIDRHYYEFGIFSELCNHLRSGDMWVVGSRQYKDFEEYLLPQEKWKALKEKNQVPLSPKAVVPSQHPAGLRPIC